MTNLSSLLSWICNKSVTRTPLPVFHQVSGCHGQYFSQMSVSLKFVKNCAFFNCLGFTVQFISHLREILNICNWTKEKGLDLVIIPLDFGLEEILFTIFNYFYGRTRTAFHIKRDKASILTSSLPDKNGALFAVSCLLPGVFSNRTRARAEELRHCLCLD